MESASSTTRAKVISIKYNNLMDKLKPLFPSDRALELPKLEEYDLADVIFYFSLVFTNEDNLYKDNLRTLLWTQGLQLEEGLFEQIHSIVLPFIQFLKTFG